MEYSKEFKAALSAFSAIEKDRLIFRLLKKDQLLSKKLYFELIDPETTDDKREAMEEMIQEKVMLASKYIGNPKYFLTIIRKISGEITEHVKITTDKFGDVSLNLLLIDAVLRHNEDLSRQRFDNMYKLYLYLINKTVRSLLLIRKLDEDYWMEFDEQLEPLKEKIQKNRPLTKLFNNNEIDLQWLKSENIPDYFDLIIKDIKSQGFLR